MSEDNKKYGISEYNLGFEILQQPKILQPYVMTEMTKELRKSFSNVYYSPNMYYSQLYEYFLKNIQPDDGECTFDEDEDDCCV